MVYGIQQSPEESMKRLLVLFLVFGLAVGAGFSQTLDLSGEWRSRNTTDYTSNEDVFSPGLTTITRFRLVSRDEQWVIEDFQLSNQLTDIDWEPGRCTVMGHSINGMIQGGFSLNGQDWTVAIEFTVELEEGEARGSGRFRESMSTTGMDIFGEGDIVLEKN